MLLPVRYATVHGTLVSSCSFSSHSGASAGCLGDADPSVVNSSLSSAFNWKDEQLRRSSVDNILHDKLELDDLPIDDLSMRLAQRCHTDSGLLSLGHAKDDEPPLSGLLRALVDQGLIATEAFSVWLSGWKGHIGWSNLSPLDHQEADRRQKAEVFSFGAVDKNKYSSSLATLDFVHAESSSQRPIILLSQIKASSQTGHKVLMTHDDTPYPVVVSLDLESSYLLQNIAEAIWQEAGAEYLEACGCPAVPCTSTESYNTFTYGFGGTNGPQIEMHLWTMVIV